MAGTGWLSSILIVLAASLTAAEVRKTSPAPGAEQEVVAVSATDNNEVFVRRTVTFTNGEPAGILQDVVMNWSTGQPEFGVLRLGDNIHPDAGSTLVPWTLFRFKQGNNRPQILVSKEQLRNAPRLALAQAEHVQDPSILNEARQYYGARGSADSGLSGTLRGSDSSGPDTTGGRYLGAGSKGASIAVYIIGALIVGLIAGRFLLYRRSEAQGASAGD